MNKQKAINFLGMLIIDFKLLATSDTQSDYWEDNIDNLEDLLKFLKGLNDEKNNN